MNDHSPGSRAPSGQAQHGAASPISARAPEGALRAGEGEPLVLLHGVIGGAAMWRHVVPLLASHYDVIALNALGHHGGTACTMRPARIAHVVDDAERSLDLLGFSQVHLAGNSMGGWVALELARRGRALSVCALSPAGMWEGTRQLRATSMLRATSRLTRLTRPILPWLAGSKVLRRFALQSSAVHASGVSGNELIELADILLGCSIAEDLFATPERFTRLTASCPVTIAWSGRDRVFPPSYYEGRARELVPDAHVQRLEGVGHVPMFDDPRLVAQTIRAALARCAQSAEDARPGRSFGDEPAPEA